MSSIGWIAVNVFRESVRDRVPYNLVLFAVLLIASSFLLGQLTAAQRDSFLLYTAGGLPLPTVAAWRTPKSKPDLLSSVPTSVTEWPKVYPTPIATIASCAQLLLRNGLATAICMGS